MVAVLPTKQRTLEITEDSSLPLWHEIFVGTELFFLHLSPIYYGIGVPRGDGSATIVVPGFLGNDLYLLELYNWLQRIGYRSHLSNIGQNAQCPEILSQRLIKTVKGVCGETNGQVRLVGHSLGGVLARSVATRIPEMVAQVVTLASPFNSIRVHPYIIHAKNEVTRRVIETRVDQGLLRPKCYTDQCDCEFSQALREGLPSAMSRTAIYTKADGVVDWHSCVEEDPRYNLRVFSASHTGLVFNSDAFWAIGKALSNFRLAN